MNDLRRRIPTTVPLVLGAAACHDASEGSKWTEGMTRDVVEDWCARQQRCYPESFARDWEGVDACVDAYMGYLDTDDPGCRGAQVALARCMSRLACDDEYYDECYDEYDESYWECVDDQEEPSFEVSPAERDVLIEWCHRLRTCDEPEFLSYYDDESDCADERTWSLERESEDCGEARLSVLRCESQVQCGSQNEECNSLDEGTFEICYDYEYEYD